MSTPRSFARDPLAAILPLLEDGVGETRVGNRTLLLLATPDAARETLVTQARDLVKQNVILLRDPSLEVAETGLMFSRHEGRHLEGRRRYQPFFASRRVADHTALVREEAAAVVALWAARGRAELAPDLARYATRLVFRSIFEYDPSPADRTPEDVAEVMDAFRLVIDRRASWGLLGLRSGIRFTRAFGRLDADLEALFDTPIGRATEDDRLDHDARLTELRGILLAAVDTTSAALSWAFDTLSRDAAVADRVAGDPTAVFAETLRLYPPAWYIGRMALRRVELVGRTVEPGGLVWVLPYFIHRDAGSWPDPLRFDPSRFAGGVESLRGNRAFLPFGAGTRQCLGEHLAWLAGSELLEQASTALRFAPTQPPVAPRADATLRPSRPIVLDVARR